MPLRRVATKEEGSSTSDRIHVVEAPACVCDERDYGTTVPFRLAFVTWSLLVNPSQLSAALHHPTPGQWL